MQKHKITCEEAGRYVRYNFFDEVSKKVGANKIALAHNMNDNAETILMNIIRGSGTTGLTGIPVMRENRYIRPILCLTRQEIEEYCALNNLQPKIDSTNKETIYTRNKIRLELIPYIKENFNSNIIENLNKLSQIIKDEEDFLELYVYDIIKKYYKNNRFNIDIFNYNHISIKRRILRKIIEDVYGSLNGIEHKHIDECIELIDKKETGKYLVLPHNIICKIEYQNFVVEMFKENTLEYEYKINIPGETYISEIDMHVKTKVLESLNNVKDKPFIKYFDYDKIGNDIVVRNRRQGDYIFLKGLSGKKKLKDVFIDNKVPREQRQTIPLVAKESEILWIVGMRDTARYKIDETTKHILEIKIERGAKDDA